jgi:hypothetical protein
LDCSVLPSDVLPAIPDFVCSLVVRDKKGALPDIGLDILRNVCDAAVPSLVGFLEDVKKILSQEATKLLALRTRWESCDIVREYPLVKCFRGGFKRVIGAES